MSVDCGAGPFVETAIPHEALFCVYPCTIGTGDRRSLQPGREDGCGKNRVEYPVHGVPCVLERGPAPVASER
jgi:hypothetical protein